MQCMVCPTTEAVLDQYDTYADISSVSNAYATAPMRAVSPKTEPLNEEEVYTAFEQALSGRQTVLHEKLLHLSDPALSAHRARTTARTAKHVTLSMRMTLLYSSIALIFTLLGFDLMGLLVLYK